MQSEYRPAQSGGLNKVTVGFRARVADRLARGVCTRCEAPVEQGQFTCDPCRAVRLWIREGQLRAARYIPANGKNPQWRISEADLEGFIRGCPWGYRAATMQAGRWRSLAEVIQRADPYLTAREAAAALRMAATRFGIYAQRGLIPRQRRFGVLRGREYLYRAADLAEIAETIERAREGGNARRMRKLRAGHEAWRSTGNATHRGKDLGPRRRAA